jgi:hypothetical protein
MRTTTVITNACIGGDSGSPSGGWQLKDARWFRPKGNRQNNCLREGKVHFANQACRRKVAIGCPMELS